MANINPMQPNQGRILNKSPILNAAGTTPSQQTANKETMRPALDSNLQNVNKSITPTTKSRPLGEY